MCCQFLWALGVLHARQVREKVYLNTSAPSCKPREMKSLLRRMGLSPLHIKRPSFIVVLNLINTFVLDPDTLFNVEQGNNSKALNWEGLFLKEHKGWCRLLSCNLPTRWCVWFTLLFWRGGIELVPPECKTQQLLSYSTQVREKTFSPLNLLWSPTSKLWEHPEDLAPLKEA